MSKKFDLKKWLGAAAIGAVVLSPTSEAKAQDYLTWERLPAQESAIRIELAEGLFEASELNVVHLIPSILRSEKTFSFFLENPGLYLELKGIEPESVNIDALVEAVDNLLDQYDWWDSGIDMSQYFYTMTKSKSQYGSKKNFDSDSNFISKTNTNQFVSTKFNEIEMQDLLTQQASATIRMYMDRLDFMPLITPRIVKSIVRR